MPTYCGFQAVFFYKVHLYPKKSAQLVFKSNELKQSQRAIIELD